MSTQTQTPETSQTPSESQPQSKTIASPDLSFTEYETLRRGGTLPEASAPSEPVAKAPEQKESEESETSEKVEAKEEENEPGDEDESHDDESEKPENIEKPKKKSGFQRRVDKLKAAKSQAQQEAEYWKREALKNQSATANGKEASSDSSKSIPSQKTQDGKPNPENFDTHAEYVEALTDWKVDQREKARDEKSLKERIESEHQKLVRTYNERKESFAAKTPDFDEVISEVDIPISATVRQFILESENGPELAYALAKSPEEFARICKLSPLKAASELGKFEIKIQKAPASEKETKKLTKAPKPIEPVGTGSRGTIAKSIDDPNLSFSEYERLRREQMKRRA